MHVGLAIGDDEELFFVELVAQAHVQPLGGPDRGVGVAQTSFFLRRCAGGSEIVGQILHFLVELMKRLAFGKNRRSVLAAGAECAQPLRYVDHRIGQLRADKEQGETGNQYGL